MSVVFHGEKFAGYRIIELIGCTDLATVYRAVDPVQGRTVALKVLDSRPDELARERFLRESATARNLQHPHIVPIYETAEAEGRLFIVMRYVAGGDLGALLTNGQSLDPDRVVALLSEVAAALDAAHTHGLVHRDVKPANILVETSGGGEHAYLADFGIASYVGGAGVTATSPSTWTGKPEYMAPEQFDGVVVDARTDIYSLGCVVYHCLAAAAPFSTETLSAHHHGMPLPLSTLDHRRRFSAGLDEVLARALAKRREDRYPTATAFLAAVRQALADHAYRDPAATALKNAPVPPRLARQWSLLLVTALAATILVAAGGLAIGVHYDRTGISSTASSTPPAPLRPPADPLAPGVRAFAPLPSPAPSALAPPTAAPSSSPTRDVTSATPLATPTAVQPPAPAVSVGTSTYSDSLFHATVRNTGHTELVAGAGSLSNTTAYAIGNDNCAGAHLPPGGSCVVTVRLQPPGPGDFTTILTVPIAGAQPLTFTLHGHRA
jgi:serine/threonine-protein kinase